MPALNSFTTDDCPFNLDNQAAYLAWREHKLETYPRLAEDLIIEVRDPRALSQAEHEALNRLCSTANMAIYAGSTGTDPDRKIPASLAAQFGLRNLDRNMGADDDGITSLRVVGEQCLALGVFADHQHDRPVEKARTQYYRPQKVQGPAHARRIG